MCKTDLKSKSLPLQLVYVRVVCGWGVFLPKFLSGTFHGGKSKFLNFLNVKIWHFETLISWWRIGQGGGTVRPAGRKTLPGFPSTLSALSASCPTPFSSWRIQRKRGNCWDSWILSRLNGPPQFIQLEELVALHQRPKGVPRIKNNFVSIKGKFKIWSHYDMTWSGIMQNWTGVRLNPWSRFSILTFFSLVTTPRWHWAPIFLRDHQVVF